MGDFSTERVTVSFPFEKTGVDCARPFAVKRTIGRCYRTSKGYIALFICLSSKAVHLEVVGDLPTQSFLAALRRLAGRRGAPRKIWSDNATTFHGADAELRSILREAESDWNLVQDSSANRGIKCKFIPPSASHFGGLCESNIKSTKSLMKKVIGTQNLTYQELSTLAVEIEECMTFRPLLSIAGDPEDLDVLTPGHALVGRTLEQIPRATTSDKELNKVTHWRLVQAMRDQFWKRWSHEYLHTLLQRNKWTLPKRNLQIGDVVLIVDPFLIRRGTWPLARVTDVSAGQDGLV
ncbi:uncharacterized protein LOC117169853 [Belonocnema kinseyi]|uniref:uncharacterized protein LOC117169853 n=1 Tax=Belonocnema kinseyi TaxID=2817044 RepID=UPI00143CC682|nr:uncharacterized protein LOC117169853 [Belonocnema kinseyi]